MRLNSWHHSQPISNEIFHFFFEPTKKQSITSATFSIIVLSRPSVAHPFDNNNQLVAPNVSVQAPIKLTQNNFVF